ncbi:hypothetical protein TNCV_9031 [Trichonephila clavipes]|nr:hypothetical protein TNCV_9031 [Trichonephila clavipes]
MTDIQWPQDTKPRHDSAIYHNTVLVGDFTISIRTHGNRIFLATSDSNSQEVPESKYELAVSIPLNTQIRPTSNCNNLKQRSDVMKRSKSP